MTFHLIRQVCLSIALLLLSALSLARTTTVVVLGDSLSAEYGLSKGAGWVSLLQQQLRAQGKNITLHNASISGETTAGGAARVAAVLKQHPADVFIIELGGNDALRGLPIAQTQQALGKIAHAAKAQGAKVLILGMRMPPNYGPKYATDFETMYKQVAKAHGAQLLPFFLEKIAAERRYFQADGIHPTALAQPLLRDTVLPALLPLLK